MSLLQFQREYNTTGDLLSVTLYFELLRALLVIPVLVSFFIPISGTFGRVRRYRSSSCLGIAVFFVVFLLSVAHFQQF